MHRDDLPRLRLRDRLRGLTSDERLAWAGTALGGAWALVGALMAVETLLRWSWALASSLLAVLGHAWAWLDWIR